MAPRKQKSQSSSETQPTQPLFSQSWQSPGPPRPSRPPSRQRGQNNPAAGSSSTQATQPVSPPAARRGKSRKRTLKARNASAQTRWELYEDDPMELSASPRIRPFVLHVFFRLEAKQPKGATRGTKYAINVCQKTFPEDGGHFPGKMSPAAAMTEARQELLRSYTYASVITGIQVEDSHTGSSKGAKPTPITERVLRGGGGGTAVINNSWSLGQRENLLKEALELRVDGECVAAQVTKLVLSTNHRTITEHRTPEQAAKHAKGAKYFSFTDIIDRFDRLYPKRSADGKPGGMTLRALAQEAEHFGVHLIAINDRNRVVMNHDYRTNSERKHRKHNAWVLYAGNGHTYFLDNNEAREFILKSISKIVHTAGGDDSAALGRFIKRPDSEVNDAVRIAAEDARPFIQGAPDPDVVPFDQWQSAIYEESSANVARLYDQLIARSTNLPDERDVRKEKQTVREFSYYLDPNSRRRKVTIFSTGTLQRSPYYRTACNELFKLYGASMDVNHFSREIYSRGAGTMVSELTRAVLQKRKMPAADTKRKVLEQQDFKCFVCGEAFTTNEYAANGSEPVVAGVVKPCWEHKKPHKAGGRDVSVKNIAALCLVCMKAKDSTERTHGAYTGVENEFTSYFNSAVRREMDAHGSDKDADEWPTVAKMNQYRATVPVDEATGKPWRAHEVDVNKCRRFILAGEARKRWPVFSVCDEIEEYAGDATHPGYYYVRTSDTELFHADGWYSQPMIEYGLAEGFITHNDIFRMLIASRTLAPEYFDKEIMRKIEEAIAETEAIMLQRAKSDDERELIELAFKEMRKDMLGNIFVGTCGRRNATVHTEQTTLDRSQMEEECDARDSTIARKIRRECDKEVAWRVQSVVEMQLPGCRYAIYKHVVELERVMLVQMERRVLAAGGVLMYAKTDAVGYALPPGVPEIEWLEETYEFVDPYPDSKSQLHPSTGRARKFKIEPLGGLKTKNHIEPCRSWRLSLPALLPPPDRSLSMGVMEAPPQLAVATVVPQDSRRDATETAPAPALPLAVGQLTKEETAALGDLIVASGASLLITGAGGCGKSYAVAHGVAPALRKAKITYIIATPTLTTRQNLRKHKGCEETITIAKLLMLYRHRDSFFGNVIPPNHPHAIIIDEISMADEMCYQMLCYIKYRRPLVRFILVGDFSQLDPVCDDWLTLPLRTPSDPPRSYSTAAPLRDLTNGCILRMTHSHRTKPGEERHLAALKASREGQVIDIDAYAGTQHTLMNICVTNAKCDEVNEKIDELYRQAYFAAFSDAPPAIVVPRYVNAADARELHLVEGTRLLGRTKGGGCPPGGVADESRVYRKQLYKVNKVEEVDLEVVTMDDGDPVYSTVKTKEASKLFRNGWALTVHCVQGLTISEKYTIHQYHHRHMSDQSKYVALSRAERGKQVIIDASDRPLDVLSTPVPPTDGVRPSCRDFRREYLDTQPWEELLARADELPQTARAILARFAEGVRATTAGGYVIDTTYSVRTGRKCALNTFSQRNDGALQQLMSPLRKAVLGVAGHDIDIRSAHPTLLLQYLRKSGFEGETPYLQEYVDEREAVYARIASELRACEQIDAAKISDKMLKIGVTRTMFLGQVSHWLRHTLGAPAALKPAEACPSLVSLARDFAIAAAFIAERNPEAVNRAKYRHTQLSSNRKKNAVAGAVSEVMGSIETEVVGAIEDCAVLQFGLRVRALIYDGLVVQHAAAELPEGMLAAAEAYALEKTGYAITLVEKEMYGYSVDACIAECRSRVGMADAVADVECAHMLSV